MMTDKEKLDDLLAKTDPLAAQRARLALGEPIGEPAMTKDELFDLAKAAVADRGLNYGSPEDNFGRIATLWQAHFINRFKPGSDLMVTPADVAIMMALLKIARLENDPSHLDSWTDIAGYAACGATLKKDA